jgi:methylenetetrahydrofolate reductase (NADPH)
MNSPDAPVPARPRRRPVNDVRRALLTSARFEVIPLRNVVAQIPHLPPGCEVSVTCSPTKGIEPTIELAGRLQALGHHAVPHLSARLVEDADHVRRLAKACRQHGFTEVFLVAGDVPAAVGHYEGVVDLLRDLLDTDAGLTRIGVTAYPDEHPLIDRTVVHQALHAKQALLADAGIDAYASTQMCFDVAAWKAWAVAERAAGLRLPLHLGVPGVVDRTKLLTIGMRLGVGASLRFVKKNRGTLSRLFAPSGYDPTKMLDGLVDDADALGITALHVFTFNSVDTTAAWRERQLRKLG